MAYAPDETMSYTTSEEPAKRALQLPTADIRLREESEKLLAISSELEKRLEPLLRPPEPEPEANGNRLETVDRDPTVAPLAARFEESIRRISYAGARLQRLLGRLEI